MYRGCGLAVRLVRDALAGAETPLMEALAAMGRVHPFFERAGMAAYPLPPDRPTARLLSAAEAVGLSRRDLAAVRPVDDLLARGGAGAAFFRRELDRCRDRALRPRRAARVSLADVCRRAACQYVYYLAETGKD